MVAPTEPGHPNRRAVVIAGHTGDVDTVRRALAAGDPEVRASALAALARIGIIEQSDLLDALRDESFVVRRRAVELAASRTTARPEDTSGSDPGGTGNPIDGLLTVMLDATCDASSDTPTGDHPAILAEVAAWSLGERHQDGEASTPKAIVRALCDATTGHFDPLVREAAVAALGAIGAPASLDAILRACTDKATVRRRAVLALAPFSGTAVDAVLEQARTDRDWQVRQAAQDLLGAVDPAPRSEP